MKIISGMFKGRIIEMPKDIRPTSDKARGALFEILKDRIQDSVFIDLYCGSGAVGIEALSRGAGKVVFIDNNPNCISVLRRNLSKLEISKNIYDIYNKDCIDGIRTLQIGRGRSRPPPTENSFDIIFLDPPYYKDIAKNTLLELSKCDILIKHALIIVEAFKKDILSERIGNLEKFRSCKYGDTKLEFYRKVESGE